MKSLKPEPLTAAAFAPFGDVIEMRDDEAKDMNYGMAKRFHALAKVDASAEGGFPIISLVHSKKYAMPQQVKLIERHPLGSQAFIPVDNTPFILLVGRPGDGIESNHLRAFVTNGSQGINYHTGVWHGLLLTPFGEMTFICVDRDGAGDNCEELYFEPDDQFTLSI